MSDRIAVTSADLSSEAGQLRSTASQLAETLQSALGRVNALSSNWQGRANEAFTSYYDEANRNFLKVQEALEHISGMLDQSASAYEEAEATIANAFSR